MYSEIRLSTHAFVPKNELNYPLPKLRKIFTLTSRYEPNVSVKVFKETQLYFGYPLYYTNFSTRTNNLIDERVVGSDSVFSMAESFTLRENQIPIMEQFLNPGSKDATGWLINLGTGFGKTVLAINMLQKLARTALVIVPRDSLISQWVERILEFTNISESEIGIAQQNRCDFEGKKIVIGMIHSIIKDKYPEEFKSYFGTIVFDEVHVSGAQSFSQSLGMFPAKYKLGMSATINRRDGLSNAYFWSLGEHFLAPRAVNTLIQPKVFLRQYTTKTRHPYVMTMKDAKSRRGVLISALASDLARNALLAVYAKKFYESGRRVVVFSDRVEQLKILKELLIKRHGVNVTVIGLFTGSTKEAVRKSILENSSIILATYGVMAMGVDVPDLRAVIFGTPLSDVAQSVGRILRLCKDAKEPIVLDVIDTVYPDCVRWSYSRQFYYEKTARAKLFNVR